MIVFYKCIYKIFIKWLKTEKDPFEGLFPRSIKKENATKFDYDAKTEKWSETKIKIQILDEAFAEGSMRQEKFSSF